MSVHTLAFSVNKQTLEKHEGFERLVAGTSGYLRAAFSFSSDWVIYRDRAAVFTGPGGLERRVDLKNNTCMVPDDIAACMSFKVHVEGESPVGAVMRSGRVTVIQRRH